MRLHTFIKITSIFSFVTINLFGAVLPEIISADLSLPAGIHTLSNSSTIEVGVTLTFSPVSTLQFVNVDSKLHVLGTLNADGTTFTGDTSEGKWGQILCESSSECSLLNCFIDNGGLSPALPISNAMFYSHGANIAISNTVAMRPRGHCFGFEGGKINFNNNIAIAKGYSDYTAAAICASKDWPTLWQSSGNVLTGGLHEGIWLDGDFIKDLNIDANDDMVKVIDVNISNCIFTLSQGTQLGFYDYSKRSLVLNNNAVLLAHGTETSPIVFSNFYGKNAWFIELLSGSKAYFSYANIYKPYSFSLSNAYICLSNTYFSELNRGLSVNYESEMCAYRTTFSGIISPGLEIQNSSSANLRECSFVNNNPPYSKSLSVDETSSVDARYCWWDASDGPYPFGNYFNEHISTNGNINCFPWLLAAAGSQTNPPSISITSHSEPAVVAGPQILLLGTATDNSKVTRVEYRNLASGVTGVASLNGSSWEANCWLFEGINQIGLTVYDDEGNAAVAGIIVECTGDGVGNGGQKAPIFNPLADRVVTEGIALEIGVAAYSPEPSILTYWAENLPDQATFNQITREFSWDSPVEGIYNNILFIATDGKFVASNSVNITVVSSAAPPVNILTKVLPDAYKYNTYYVLLSTENAVGPVEWTLVGNVNLPDGLVLSRAGILSGVPTDKNDETIVFDVKATDSRGSEDSSTTTLSISYHTTEPPADLNFPTQPLPFCVNGTTYNAQLFATNGAGSYDFSEASAVLNSIGLSILNDGSITGTVNSDVMVPWAALVTDETNASAIANLVIPAIKPDKKLELIPGKNMLKLIVKQSPTTLTKSKIIFKATLTPPSDFILDESTIVTAMIGVNQIDGKLLLKSVLDKKILFKKKVGFMLEKVLVKKLADGNLKAMFILKNVDLTKSFVDWGLKNEDLLVPTSFDVPVFIRIGDGYTVNEIAPTMVKSKFNKISKGKAKW